LSIVADGPVAADGVRIPIRSGGQQWLVSWHPPPEPPDGTPHGAEGVCVTADGALVVISPDGIIWDLPAGRPEPGESWEQTLRREMDEEACATVVGVRLLGFTRGQCLTGPERGTVLVRSAWRADVELRRGKRASRSRIVASLLRPRSGRRSHSARTHSPRSSGASSPKLG
jgi:ADP-ribose pyrophosphatase YjhB (NUDIX family)